MKALYVLAGMAAVVVASMAETPASFNGAADAMVKPDGTIVMTRADYQRDWTALGTWAHVGKEGVARFNVVYTQPETVTSYRKTGEFPAGAVLIKELRKGVTKGDGDNEVSSLGALTGWFVMIKPSPTETPEGPLWGEGWGWAKFDVDAPEATITKSYKTDCRQCHVPVKDTDWVHVTGYPLLGKSSDP
ncbi:MAG: cytochrome P460 family protein [Devosia sp.]